MSISVRGGIARTALASCLVCAAGIGTASAQVPQQQLDDAKKEAAEKLTYGDPKLYMDFLVEQKLNVEVDIDWAHWDLKELPKASDAIDICYATLAALGDLSKEPGWKEAAQKSIHKIACRFDGTHTWSKASKMTVDHVTIRGEHRTVSYDQGQMEAFETKDMELKGDTFIYHMSNDHTNLRSALVQALHRDLKAVRINGLTPDQIQQKAKDDTEKRSNRR